MDFGIPNNIKIFASRGSYVYVKRRTPKFIIFDEYDKNGILYKENTKRKILKAEDNKLLQELKKNNFLSSASKIFLLVFSL